MGKSLEKKVYKIFLIFSIFAVIFLIFYLIFWLKLRYFFDFFDFSFIFWDFFSKKVYEIFSSDLPLEESDTRLFTPGMSLKAMFQTSISITKMEASSTA